MSMVADKQKCNQPRRDEGRTLKLKNATTILTNTDI